MPDPGLCSVTFRSLAPAEVLEAAARAGLRTVEWGGDVHVPPGDLRTASEVAARTADTGLRTVSYGSYVVLGHTEPDDALATAVALGAPLVRVWAGKSGSRQASPDDRRRVVSAAQRMADAAADHGIAIATEFHRGTLTDTVASTLELLEDTERPNVLTHWQPPVGANDDESLHGLRVVLPHLAHVHAFSWTAQGERLPLAARAAMWQEVVAIAGDRSILLEFVEGDLIESFDRDAATLVGWLA